VIIFLMRKALLAAVLAALLLLPVLKFSREDGLGRTAASGSFLEDVKVVRREAGRTVWSLGSKRASISGDANTAGMSEVAVLLPGHGLAVTADAGVYDLRSNDVSLEGGVIAKAEDFTVSTGRVRLASANGEIATDGGVVITGKGFIIRGRGLRAYDGKVMLLADVRAELF
jgi:hypothetical protein